MKKNLKELTKSAGIEAQYRVASNQISKAGRAAILKAFSAANPTSDAMKGLEAFLETDLGLSLVSFGIGTALSQAPIEDPRVHRLADEFATEGIAKAGNTLIGALAESVLPIFNNTMDKLPQPVATARIAEGTSSSTSLEAELVDDQKAANKRK